MEGKKIVGKREGRRKVSKPRINISFYGSTLKIWNDCRRKLNVTHDNFALMLICSYTESSVSNLDEKIINSTDDKVNISATCRNSRRLKVIQIHPLSYKLCRSFDQHVEVPILPFRSTNPSLSHHTFPLS